MSEVVTVELATNRFDETRLDLTTRIEASAADGIEPSALAAATGVALVRHPSALLRAHGRSSAASDAMRADTLTDGI